MYRLFTWGWSGQAPIFHVEKTIQKRYHASRGKDHTEEAIVKPDSEVGEAQKPSAGGGCGFWFVRESCSGQCEAPFLL